METISQIEKIQSKLRKLIKLQEGAIKIGSESEAAAAAAAIQRLLLQYNLSMEDIDVNEKPAQGVDEMTSSWYTYKFIGGDWEFRLMAVCAKHNLCKCLYHGDKKHKKMLILGLPQNMETVKWLHSMLCERFVELGKAKYKEFSKTEDSIIKPIGLDTYLRRYLVGCALGLDEKLTAEEKVEIKQDVEFSAKITSLVLRNDSAITKYLESKYSTTKTKTRGVKMDDAFNQGLVDGKNASIHKAVKTSKDAQINNVKLLS